MSKELLFSVTASDCRWDYYRGSGKGGQNRNKLSTAVRCTHEPSGAVGSAEDSRSQLDNRRAAFKRMTASKQFQQWIMLESARRTGKLIAIDEAVDRAMSDGHLLVEGKDDAGRWAEDAIMVDTEVER